MNSAVAGTGYVGLFVAILLTQKHQVTAVDIVPEKVEKDQSEGVFPFRMSTLKNA